LLGRPVRRGLVLVHAIHARRPHGAGAIGDAPERPLSRRGCRARRDPGLTWWPVRDAAREDRCRDHHVRR
jgi:hypothetical protein